MREINVTFLDKYEVFLRSRGGTNGGIAVCMRSLRIIINLVIRIDLIKQNLYPFHKHKISKHRGKRIKHPLTIAEIAFFKNVDCEEDIQYSNTKNYFLFSFYTRGINFTAIIRLRWSEIINQRVTYDGLKHRAISL